MSSEHVIIIIVVFSIIVTGLIISGLYSCTKELYEDHKVIQVNKCQNSRFPY